VFIEEFPLLRRPLAICAGKLLSLPQVGKACAKRLNFQMPAGRHHILRLRPFIKPSFRLNEDCLYLNIWTPAKSAKDRLPVMVWIHGGGFTRGFSGTSSYNLNNYQPATSTPSSFR
jgi:hypothetical protein